MQMEKIAKQFYEHYDDSGNRLKYRLKSRKV